VTSVVPAVRSRHRHSPRMRRLASNLGVSLDRVTGTGPGGRVQARDVHSAATDTEHPAPPPAGSGQLMTVVEADVTSLPEGVTLTALLARAVVGALRSRPLLNSAMSIDGAITANPAQHLGIAVDTDGGPVVPVLRDAGDLTMAAVARRTDELISRARAGTVSSDECSGGTFTMTDLSSRGILFDTPSLVPGQVGTLGVGSVVERPAVVTSTDGERAIAIRSIVYLALTYDGRVVSGADAARFLHVVADRLDARHSSSEL
jgi:pyruvate dehydrogenase E2 component (dihydrolipoamide acetyltransferase)